MLNTSQFIKDELQGLVQKENFVGWVYSIDYEKALVITNDLWKSQVKGIPHNSFLLATSFEPDKYGETDEQDKEVVLLRVIGSCRLPQDDDMIRTKIDNYQNKTGVFSESMGFDTLTRNKLQFGGLECRVLGTFYMKGQELNLGSDVETFYTSLQMRVFMPTGESLEQIVNYVDPIRKKRSKEDFKELGIKGDVTPFRLGTVRYTSTDRLHRADASKQVPFCIQPADFLARRTAVLGMTRTGKSNMIKQTVSVVKGISDAHNLKIGQLIFDINGEYANANTQDSGSISSIYESECIKYRAKISEGFEPILNDFYEQLQEGLYIIRDLVKEARKDGSADIDTFINMSLEKPDDDEYSEKTRWGVKVAIYKTLLMKSGYECNRFSVKCVVSKKIVDYIYEKIQEQDSNANRIDPNKGMSFEEAEQWFLAVRRANIAEEIRTDSSKRAWLDNECTAMLNLLAGESQKGGYIRGFRTVAIAREYHSPLKKGEVCSEIYNALKEGKIVILDLSVGNALLRERISKNIARYIFDTSMITFTEGKTPPNIVIYIEEAHNLIGKGMELTDTWPRLAKEGAKYKIALVYATQEVSSVHKNILANTENWFVSHLNSDTEIKELAHFYDFADFSKSLLRSQDVGFARVKTLSSPYVVPVQIDKFSPEKLIRGK